LGAEDEKASETPDFPEVSTAVSNGHYILLLSLLAVAFEEDKEV
jgi:hypothetical protein